ncbi:MAG: L-lactate permease [bacterium]|nr:MAG: L-lactate permease [bacterium]
MQILLAWSPVFLLFILAVFFRRSALYLAVAGYLWTSALAVAVFRTHYSAVGAATVRGFLITLPLLLVVYGGILLASVLIEAGSLKRIADWFTGATRDDWGKLGLLSVGMGNALEGAGIIAEPVAAPMLMASGLPSTASAALSIIGYSGLMTLGLGGVILTVLASVTGYPTELLAGKVAVLSVPASVMMAWSIPVFARGDGSLLGRLPFLTLLGLIPGVAAWGAVKVFGFQVGELAGGAVITLVLVLPGFRRLRITSTILKDLSPLAVMGCGIVLVNTLPGLRELARERLVYANFKPLADAYLYLFLAYLLAHFTMRVDRGLVDSLVRGSVQGWRPLAAMALFGAMGQVMAETGYRAQGLASSSHNIPTILADSLAGTGDYFILLVPFLGWVGTFLTGYGVASIMLFAKLLLEFTPDSELALLMVCGLAVGASVGGISSPFKVAFAASMTGASGEEGGILRKTIPLGIASCLALGGVLWVMAIW